MSDYKRFVSYIYEYVDGEKRESAGFVKVNARGEECKIWVHMKGFYMHGQQPYRAYVCAGKKGVLLGYPLGALENRNGALEWNCATKTDSLMESGLPLEDSRGLYIEGGGRVYAAEWDDYPVDVSRFEPADRSARQEREERKEPSAAPRLVEEISEEALAEVKPEEAEKEPALPVEEPLASAEVAEKPSEESVKPILKDSRREQWAYLTRHFPVVQYTDGEALICSIRLNSRDLSRIPRDKWGLGNNSFLFHGFYQYQHLLLLRRQQGDAVSYCVGVPGVYNEKEQMMASLFGFQEFKVMNGPRKAEGSFGYWCRRLE